ncbi:MAG: biotin--[acetyl-CoA-carboxylase] ligase [bacterium]|nr:biotin--[acetyl-CoA-carboxylase] ligase [bacterium]
MIGKKIHRLSSVGSTNDLARTLIASGCQNGEVIISDIQTAGRGRGAKEWVSPSGGLWFSIILFPSNLNADKLQFLSLIVGLVMSKVIEEKTGLCCAIRWPNDLYLKEKKVSGVLIESKLRLNSVEWLIIGIGLNLNVDKNLLPEGAGSIKEELKTEIEKESIFSALLQEMEKAYIDFQENSLKFLPEIRERCLSLGRSVRFEINSQRLIGEAIDIDEKGRLVVEAQGKTYHLLWDAELL